MTWYKRKKIFWQKYQKLKKIMDILFVQKLYVNTNTINMSIYKGIQNWIYQFIIQRSCKEIVETTL